MDTIAAISTPIGAGAIGIVRLSGEQSLSIALRFFHCSGLQGAADVTPNLLRLGTFVGETIREKCMMVYFRAPKSYTGEDIVEFHVHGGAYLTERVLETLLAAGARMAAPGEFTRRAFLNGKVTLDEAEGVARMIGAESEAELREAYSLMSGRFHAAIEELISELTKVLSTLEASLDYPEEMEGESDDAIKRAFEVRDKMQALLDSFRTGKMIKSGVTVAIVGKTNVGKSSLLNSILGYARAIVTDVHGTTRDVIEQSMVHKGVKLNFQDTAGLRTTDDLVENIGIERSRDAARGADVVLYVAESNGAPDEKELAEVGTLSDHIIFVNNKTDVYGNASSGMNVSAKTGEGVQSLLDEIVRVALGDRHSADTLSEERHADCLRRALHSLNEALSADENAERECVLVDFRASIEALYEIGGGNATEGVINDVFSRFCVGK